ncbi:MAG: ABC transporter ATP-binding protein [Methanomicrobiales archaeon]|nr:ABC transporter ATP-binding protein [Methanomicrobiales archaeon]
MNDPPTISAVIRGLVVMKSEIWRAIQLVFTHTPGWTAVTIILILILGLLPLAGLYIMKLLVDTVTMGILTPDKAEIISQLVPLLVAAAAISIITVMCRSISAYATEAQSLVMTDVVTDQIQAHSIQLDLAYYENPAYFNDLHRAQMEGPTRPAKVVNDIVQIAQSGISLVAVGALVIAFSPIAGLVLFCAAIPAVIFKVWYSRRLYALRNDQTEAERKTRYYHWMISDAFFAKEVRLFGLGPLFRQRYRSQQEDLWHARLALSRSKAFWDIVAQVFVAVAVFGSFAVIAFMAIDGKLTLGDMVMYFMGFQMCIGYIQSIFGSTNSLYEDQLFLKHLFLFLDLKPQVPVPEEPVPLPETFQDEVRVDNVTFTYPGEERPSLRNVSFVLHPGEVIAFVGSNGAGKSTLIKLLCRLYVPDSGSILVDGTDLSEVDPGTWYRHITVLFQDYVRYHLTARENIWLADVDQPVDGQAVAGAAQRAGADAVISALPGGYETILGRSFSGGHELSTGQWQKIALARAFFRDAEIVILDEPASSLDAMAEKEIFTKFREIIRGRSAVLISHRFSTVLMADRIYVLEDGQIIEQGSHTDLMAQNGRYATMFHAQADAYGERPVTMITQR